MSNKSAAERTAEAVRNANAIKSILKKFASGGWSAAALETVKNYWPQILAVACSLLLIVLIIFCSFPLLLFGADFSSSKPDMTKLSVYDGLAERYGNAVTGIVDSVKHPGTDGTQNTKTNSTAQGQTGHTVTVSAVMTSGTVIQKEMFAALHTVYLGNDAGAVNDGSVNDFVRLCMDYDVQTNPRDGSVTVNINYLSADEVMKKLGFSESQRAWTENLYHTLSERGSE